MVWGLEYKRLWEIKEGGTVALSLILVSLLFSFLFVSVSLFFHTYLKLFYHIPHLMLLITSSITYSLLLSFSPYLTCPTLSILLHPTPSSLHLSLSIPSFLLLLVWQYHSLPSAVTIFQLTKNPNCTGRGYPFRPIPRFLLTDMAISFAILLSPAAKACNGMRAGVTLSRTDRNPAEGVPLLASPPRFR